MTRVPALLGLACGFAGLFFCISLPGQALAATAEQVVEAIGLDLADVSALDTGTSAASMYDVKTGLGSIVPRESADMGLLSTGDVANLPSPDYPPVDVGSWGGSDPQGNPQPGCDPAWDLDHGAEGEPDDLALLSFELEVPAGAASFSSA